MLSSVDAPQQAEDLAQLITRIKTDYDVSESEIARRVGVSIATVNNWVHRRRRAPRPATLERIHEAFPSFTREEIHAAAGARAPGPMTPDAEGRVLGLFAQLTAEQQEITETQMQALVDRNRTGR